ncbi:hypothetical protein IWW55_001380 [Coemansia sp. RSA 2706]|nr:hypothetical protein IWW55_001380 [Coemansia sp. RSA 2706]
MKLASDEQLREAMGAELVRRRGADFGLDGFVGHVVCASVSRNTVTVRVTVTATEVNSSGTLDEGWTAARADALTGTLICVLSGTIFHTTTSLAVSVQPRPICPPAEIFIELSVDSVLQPPSASAVFRDALNPSIVYATASHTKLFKPSLAASL